MLERVKYDSSADESAGVQAQTRRQGPGGGGSAGTRPGVGETRPVRAARGWKLSMIATAAIAVGATGWWWMASRSTLIQYRTAPVTRGGVTRTVIATGTVNPVLTIIVGSYVSGVISDVFCDYNTRVKKGQLCAKIDPRPYKAALDQANGQLARDRAQLEDARLNLSRYAVLKGQDSIAQQTYDDQLALVHQLQGTVQLDRALVETAQVNLEYTSIVSPVDGTVVARSITIGQTVAASFQTPTLFLIATDLTKMQVDTNVSESDIGAVKPGTDASFTVEAFAERSFEGEVAQVRQAPQTVQNVVTYDVVVAVDNTDFLLKPGMTATVSLVTDRRRDVLRVPDQALRFVPSQTRRADGSESAHASHPDSPSPAPAESAWRPQASRQAQVWVVRKGKPTPIAITVGLDDDTVTEVIAGDLRSGESVIVGEQHVSSGQQGGTFRFGFSR